MANNINNKKILSSLSNKKRGNGETIDLNAILSLDTRVKKKRVSKLQQQQKQADEQEDDNKESNVPIVKDEQPQQQPPPLQQTTTVTTTATTVATAAAIKWDEIKVDELDSKLLNEIKTIAKSIGIETKGNTGVRKHELIEKIKLLVKRNKDTVENKIKQDNINPFNKTSFTQLVIPEGQDGINELLFWKVFKNKSIYKRIMSFMNEYPNPLQYDYIISVKSMLDNNQISLLKEKVIRNQYLSFMVPKNPYHKFKDQLPVNLTDTWLKLFQKIQNPQDTEFYIHLFTNYQHQIPYMDSNNKYEEIAFLLVRSNCLIGLQVLLQNFNYKPTRKNLFTAFKYSRPECIKLLRDEMSVETLKLVDKDQDINIISFDTKNAKIKKTIESMKLFIEIFNLSSSKEILYGQVKSNICGNLFDINPLKLRLKELIKIIGLVDTLNLWNKYDDLKNDFKYPPLFSIVKNSTYNKQTTPTTSPTILKNEMKSYTFSTLQLKSKLKDPINYKSNEVEVENIKKLLHVFYRINNNLIKIKQHYFIEYYLCYGTGLVGNGNGDYSISTIVEYQKESDLQHNTDLTDTKVAKYALKFGQFSVLKNWLTISKIQSSSNYIYGLYCLYDDDFISTNVQTSKSMDILFRNCQDKQLQIQFINSIVQDIKSGNGNTTSTGSYQVPSSAYIMFVFITLLNYNDLDLLKHYVNSIGKQIIFPVSTSFSIPRSAKFRNKKSCFSNALTRYVKSTEVLDYLFTEFYHLIRVVQVNSFNQSVTNYIFQNSNLELLKHFQKLHIEKKNMQTPQNKISVIGGTVSMAEYCFDNLTHYRIQSVTDTKPIDFDQSDEKMDTYFNALKSCIISTPFLQFSPLLFYSDTSNEYPPKQFIKYYEWFIELQSSNQTHSYYNNVSKRTLAENNILLKYFSHGSDQLFKDYSVITNGYFRFIIKYSIKRGDLNSLNSILVIFKTKLQELKTIAKPTVVNSAALNSITEKEKIKNSITNFILKYILKVAVEEEQLLVLEYLLLNHNHIFKKKIEVPLKSSDIVEDDGLFTQQELRELVFTSLENYNIKITEFLLSLFTITKSQFEKHANPTSLIHFKNKFK